MATDTMLGPAQLYEQAVRNTRKIFAGVKPDQLSNPTPCEKWNVRELMEHITGGIAMTAHSFDVSRLTNAEHQATKAGITLAQYDAAMSRALACIVKHGNLEKLVRTPMGEMPGGNFLMVLFMDNLTHGWDLAKATGQDTHLPSHLVDACYENFAPGFADLSKTGAFAPPVTVPPAADKQAKLLAGLGRRP